MSFSFTLSGNSSVINYNFNPPIYLEENVDYEIGLVNFSSFNTIPNVDKSNNMFLWYGSTAHTFEIPVGAYELNDIIRVLKDHMTSIDKAANIEIIPNLNTAHLSITSNRDISFNLENSVSKIFGFETLRLLPNKTHISEHPVKILKVNSIGIDCNVATGSYLNGKPVHVIHQFFPTVPSGYKIVESPQNILYYPVSNKTISNIIIKIIDQSNNLIDFQGEEITVTLHIRKTIQ